MDDDRTTRWQLVSEHSPFEQEKSEPQLAVSDSEKFMRTDVPPTQHHAAQSLSEASDRLLDASANGLGTVLAVQANFYFVRLDEAPHSPGLKVAASDATWRNPEAQSSLLCTRRSRLKKVGQDVCVGDRVRVEEPDWQGGRGAIAEVLPRRTALDRPPIANVDQIFLVFALAEPDLDPIQMSRFLVKAESTGVQVFLGLNKSDLVSIDQHQQWRDRLQQWGYESLIFSLHQNPYGIEIQHLLQNRITVISGPSGVGKSSLINHLIPAVDLRTGEVSGKLGKGRHTTRHVELFELPLGGFLADTPGFNQPDLSLSPQGLAQCFPEIRQRLQNDNCQFKDCLHRDEPNCVVKGDWERYEHYLILLEEAIAHEESQARSRDNESSLKIKTGESGESRYEPKLATKKYRRPSRRSQKQSLQNLYQDIDALLEEDSEHDDDDTLL